MALVMWRLPGSFLPTEDQGSSWCSSPCRGTAPRTDAVASK
jgi:multidrug efflux pump